jgi:hypothetical protein
MMKGLWHGVRLSLCFLCVALCCLADSDADHGWADGSSKRTPEDKRLLCGQYHEHECKENDFVCLKSHFELPDASELVSVNFRNDPLPPATEFAKAMKTLYFFQCGANLEFPSEKRALCGSATKYYAAVTDRLGRPLGCMKEGVKVYTRLSNASKFSLDAFVKETDSTCNLVRQHKSAVEDGRVAAGDLDNEMPKICKCVGGTYVALVGYCEPSSAALRFHLFFIFLVWGIALPISYRVSKSKEVVRKWINVAAFVCIMCVAITGAVAPEVGPGGESTMATIVCLTSAAAILYTEAKCSQQLAKCVHGRIKCFIQTLKPAILFFLSQVWLATVVLKSMKICYPERVITIEPGNDCPPHFGVGFILGAYGIGHLLLALQVIQLKHEVVIYEYCALMLAGVTLLVTTFMLKGPSASWPWTGYSVADNQHIGLYLILTLFPGVGLLAIKLKLVGKKWNAPAALAASWIGVLLILHDPKSHGLHKSLHVYTGYAWIAAIVCRLFEKNMFVGFFSPLAGILFCSVTFAHPLSKSLSDIDALGIVLMAASFVAVLNTYVVLLAYLIKYFRGGMGKSNIKPSEMRKSKGALYSTVGNEDADAIIPLAVEKI